MHDHDTAPRHSTTSNRLSRGGGWTVLARLAAAATIAYTLVLVYATHHPRPRELVGDSPPSDKTLHLWAYAVLAGLAGITLALSGGWRPRAIAWLAAGLALFAALDEATQPLPWFGRTADPLDWVYDGLGIAVGLAAVAMLVRLVGLVWHATARRTGAAGRQ